MREKTKMVGKGGIKCFCCRPFSKSKTKKVHNRVIRRRNRKVNPED